MRKVYVGPLFYWGAVITLLSIHVTGQTNSTIEVPFELVKNEIVVSVSMNDQGPFEMLVDTGTDPSAVDLGTARKIGLKLSETGRRSAGGGTDVNIGYKCRLSSVKLGGLSAKDVDAGAIDLAKISERMGRHIDGVLGHSFLNHRIVQFDYPAKVLRFFEKTPAGGTAAKFTSLPFRYDDDILIDGILVNGTSVTAVLDTGSGNSFTLSPFGVEKLGLSDQYKLANTKVSVGYNGQFESYAGKLRNVTIGNISIDEPNTIFFTRGTGHDKVPWSLNIGNAFLKEYVVTIDYKRKTVTLEKR